MRAQMMMMRTTPIVAGICLVLSTVADRAEGAEQCPDPIRFVLTSLRPGCEMKAGFMGGHRHLQVTVVCEGAAPTRVRSLTDLRGLVTIDEDQKALEFVRLFSAGGRWMLTGVADHAEVVAGEKAEAGQFIVREDTFTRCCVAPTVRKVEGLTTDTAFEVRRTVVDQSYDVYLLTEVVERDGGWRIIDQKPLEGVDGRDLGVFAVHDR
jgi:hypothetical protein